MTAATWTGMRRVVLSPHCDDAVLSCGGWLVDWRDRASVINVFSGRPDFRRLAPTPILEAVATMMGRPADPIAVRRDEDAEALALYGIVPRHLDHLDAAYRQVGGEHLYPTWLAMTGDWPDADRSLVGLLAGELQALLPPARTVLVVAPLAIGGHIDHRIVRAAAEQLADRGHAVGFYEDMPYVATRGVPAEVAQSPNWRAVPQPVDLHALAIKARAIAAYGSQKQALAGGLLGRAVDPDELPGIDAPILAAITRCARAAGAPEGLAERLWMRTEAA